MLSALLLGRVSLLGFQISAIQKTEEEEGEGNDTAFFATEESNQKNGSVPLLSGKKWARKLSELQRLSRS
jgi:hypothetical protein